jgi:hypothetical protein
VGGGSGSGGGVVVVVGFIKYIGSTRGRVVCGVPT